MKRTILLVLLTGASCLINAQNTPYGIEITNNNVKITTLHNGKAYYNGKELATKEDAWTASIHARAIFHKVSLNANVRTYLSVFSVEGTQNVIRKDDAENLVVIPQDGYYYINLGPIRLASSMPAKLNGRLIAKTQGAADWVVLYMDSMYEAGTTYSGFTKMLYLKAGTILEFALTSSATTSLSGVGELTNNNELSIVRLPVQ